MARLYSWRAKENLSFLLPLLLLGLTEQGKLVVQQIIG